MKKRFFANTKHRRAIYQTEKNILERIRRLFALLALLLLIHVCAMMLTEKFTFFESLWLTLTTLTTVGYGDLSATTMIGRVATIVLLYFTGITILTLIISDYIDYRFFKREHIRTGKWKWNMVEHIVIINSPKNNPIQYYVRLINQIRANPSYQSTPIQILTDRFSDGLPTELANLGVVYFDGRPDNPKDLSAVNIRSARHILILAKDENDSSSDSTTFDVVHRLKEHNLAHLTIAECVRDSNRERLLRQGIRSVIRPVRTYPEILVTAMTAPGSEKLMEDLFTHENDHTVRYQVEVDHMPWSDVVCALMQAGFGTAMAYVDEDEEVICHPPAEEKITARALIVLVKTERTPTDYDIQQAVYHYLARERKWAAMKEKFGHEFSNTPPSHEH